MPNITFPNRIIEKAARRLYFIETLGYHPYTRSREFFDTSWVLLNNEEIMQWESFAREFLEDVFNTEEENIVPEYRIDFSIAYED